MVVDRVQPASVDSTTQRIQDAIAGVNDQILPGGLGGVGSGFVAPPYSNAALLYGIGMGVPAAPTKLSGEPFQATFGSPQAGIQVADASNLIATMGQEVAAHNAAMLARYQMPPLDPQAGQPKLVPWDGHDQLAKNAQAAATLDAMRGSTAGGIAGGLAYLAGGSDTTAYFAAASLGSLESIAAGAVGFQMPMAPQAGSYANRLRTVAQANVDEVPSIGWPGKGGSGPAPGVIGITDSTSVNALRNFYPRGGGVEFVYDPTTNRFAAGSPTRGLFDGSPHEQLARSIGSFGNPSLVGGTFQRGPVIPPKNRCDQK